MNTVKAIDSKKTRHKAIVLSISVLVALFVFQGAAYAQDPSQVDHYDNPYGMGYGDESRPYQVTSTRDANGNRVIINGRFATSGSYTETSGVGGYNLTGRWGVSNSAQAIGNQLTVVTTGSNNTVIIDSTQINNGDQEAGIVLNGDIDFD